MVELAVSSGVAQIKPDSHVVLMADTAERAEDIDVERAEQARKRAEELLAQAADQADVDFAYLQAKIQKELARTHVGNRWRK
jgi:F-type H+-transporting ATPase subunit epsilon